MKSNILNKSIQITLNNVFQTIGLDNEEFSLEQYRKIKSKNTGSGIASKLGINEQMLVEFEEAIKQFYAHQGDSDKNRLSCLRAGLWLETITKKLTIPFEFESALGTEELAIKQVRALELIIRDVITEQLGGSENVILKLKELFKQDVIDKWLKSADETGILSGTTFSELSNVLLDKNIFKSIEEIFQSTSIEISRSARESLRYILEDIRLIRNAIAHNKKVSLVQIEALNEYYKTISNIVAQASKTEVDPKRYLDLSNSNMESYLSTLREDNKEISISINQINETVTDIKSDTTEILQDSKDNKKRNLLIIVGVLILILLGVSTLYLLNQQNLSTTELGSDLKEVKNIVKADGEIKNMNSSADLTATKNLNNRTKNANAKRIAIIYFENSGGNPNLEKLKKGLADMLITDLSNINMLSIVERSQIENLIKEQKLNNSKSFDPSTASKLGKLLGAQIILTGGYFEMMGSLRLDARFIDVETGKILKSDGVDGQTSNFFKIQKQLAWKIINTLDVKVSPEEKKLMQENEKSKALSFEDAILFSKALDFNDIGDDAKAKNLLEKVVSKYPDFVPAKNLISKMK